MTVFVNDCYNKLVCDPVAGANGIVIFVGAIQTALRHCTMLVELQLARKLKSSKEFTISWNIFIQHRFGQDGYAIKHFHSTFWAMNKLSSFSCLIQHTVLIKKLCVRETYRGTFFYIPTIKQSRKHVKKRRVDSKLFWCPSI